MISKKIKKFWKVTCLAVFILLLGSINTNAVAPISGVNLTAGVYFSDIERNPAPVNGNCSDRAQGFTWMSKDVFKVQYFCNKRYYNFNFNDNNEYYYKKVNTITVTDPARAYNLIYGTSSSWKNGTKQYAVWGDSNYYTAEGTINYVNYCNALDRSNFKYI